MEIKNKSIMVTGGAGFIGSHLVDRLIVEKPEKIVVVDNFFLGKKHNLDDAEKSFENLTIYNADAADQKKMGGIIKNNDVDVVFNLAVIPLLVSFKKPKWTYWHNVDMTMGLCELLRKGAYDTLIQCSSSEVYGTAEEFPMSEKHPLNPKTPYAASKASADLLVTSYQKTFDLDVSIVRPFNNYGPRQNEGNYAAVIPITIRRILNGQTPIIYGDGKQTRDYIYVTDTADALVETYKSKKTRSKTINIASGKEIQIGKLVGMVAQHMGYNKKIKHEKVRPADVMRHLGDIKLAKKLIGFKPKVGFDEGLKRTIDDYLKTMPTIKNKKSEDPVYWESKYGI